MSRTKIALLFYVAVALVLNMVVLGALYLEQGRRVLTVSFLKVGQGDAILITSPSGAEVLIDGGPDRSVLREIPHVLGPIDRSLDLVIATHPDKDHIAGLAEVLERFEVKAVMEPGIPYGSSYAEALSAGVKDEEGVERVYARRGMRIHLGAGAYADVLYPDRDVAGVETNTGSIVLRVVYGETEFMLTGDAPASVEDWVVAGGGALQSDVLKAGHHGSRTSTGEGWMEAVRPTHVVISAGKGNSYGHPHEEVVERVSAHGATLHSTQEGRVTFISDGTAVWRK